MKHFVALLLLLVAFTVAALGQGNWRVDKAHSSMMFTIRHLVISEVVGNFKEWDMKVTSSKEDWTNTKVEAVAKITSINTENERRDADLRSDNFFSADKFPEMKFVSESFEKVGDNQYKIKGHLTIRDITKEVTFDAEHLGTISDRRMGTRAGWKAMASINRFDFGLKWNAALETGGLVAGETVKITVNLELVKQAS
ncbi:MAG: YceI family protein [Bacteroidota bacterium]